MVYYDIHRLQSLSGTQLDDYLAEGWYRMQQLIFTTDVIVKEDKLLPVFWLRLSLDKYTPTKKSTKIKALNKKYSVEFNSGMITEEMEELYTLYKSSVGFEISESIADNLIGDHEGSIYKTISISIRDENKLIAVGFFDDGDTTMAGILNVYDPAYASKSLGKYLMLLKIEYAQQHKKKYYYTGYLSTADTKFDYKLFVSKEATEVYNRSKKEWVPWLSVEKKILEDWILSNPDIENTMP